MEPKLIKEELPDRDSNPTCLNKDLPSTHRHRSSNRSETGKSPEASCSEETRISPTPTVTPGPGPGSPKTSTPTNCHQNGSSSFPLNFTTSPPLSVLLPESGQGVSPNKSSAKIKRFLSTLVQFGNQVSPEIGDRVKSLVFSLVSNALSVEEFHHSLQEATNFPLRPFVLPFLRSYVPALQRELSVQAKAAKQSMQHYLRAHEHAVLDPAFSPSEPGEIFHHVDSVSHLKRRASSDNSFMENGQDEPLFLPKRSYHFPSDSTTAELLYPLPPSHFLHTDYTAHHFPQMPNIGSNIPPSEDRRLHAENEWKNIHVMLNCILSMVEKTKRALGILQQRSLNENGVPTSDWIHQQRIDEIMSQTIKITQDRVTQVRKKAEEAVNEVKRQAIVELQRAVSAAEIKTAELVACERAKIEKLMVNARKQAMEEALQTSTTSSTANSGATTTNNAYKSDSNQSPPSNQVQSTTQANDCWNCGRKANETCSGCNTARYCGAFCQHKDWENHHQICCGHSRNSSTSISEKSSIAPPKPSTSRAHTPLSSTTTATSLVVNQTVTSILKK